MQILLSVILLALWRWDEYAPSRGAPSSAPLRTVAGKDARSAWAPSSPTSKKKEPQPRGFSGVEGGLAPSCRMPARQAHARRPAEMDGVAVLEDERRRPARNPSRPEQRPARGKRVVRDLRIGGQAEAAGKGQAGGGAVECGERAAGLQPADEARDIGMGDPSPAAERGPDRRPAGSHDRRERLGRRVPGAKITNTLPASSRARGQPRARSARPPPATARRRPAGAGAPAAAGARVNACRIAGLVPPASDRALPTCIEPPCHAAGSGGSSCRMREAEETDIILARLVARPYAARIV